MAREVNTSQASAPMERLKEQARGLASALGERAVSLVLHKVEGTTGRLTEYVEGGAGRGLMAAVTGAKDLAEGKGPVRSMLGAGVKGLGEKVRGLFGKGGKGGGGQKLKVINIVESVDVGVPIELAYNQWTQFTDLPGFMKKLEGADQDQNEPQESHWKAQVFWSHREWDAKIVEQIPEERIIWKSTGAKGHADGAVTFHELGPSLTRILLVLEYHPQGLFERTGNLWRAQGRRARLELKHFQRHVMTNAILHPEDIEGWRGVIEDGEVVQDHEAAVAEQEQGDGQAQDRVGSEPQGEEYADDQEELEGTGPGGEYAEDEYTAGEDDEDVEDEESPNGRAAERPARAARRERRPAGGQRPSRTGERPARPVRRRAGTRGRPSR